MCRLAASRTRATGVNPREIGPYEKAKSFNTTNGRLVLAERLEGASTESTLMLNPTTPYESSHDSDLA